MVIFISCKAIFQILNSSQECDPQNDALGFCQDQWAFITRSFQHPGARGERHTPGDTGTLESTCGPFRQWLRKAWAQKCWVNSGPSVKKRRGGRKKKMNGYGKSWNTKKSSVVWKRPRPVGSTHEGRHHTPGHTKHVSVTSVAADSPAVSPCPQILKHCLQRASVRWPKIQNENVTSIWQLGEEKSNNLH